MKIQYLNVVENAAKAPFLWKQILVHMLENQKGWK